jgi:hypothetical protein
MSPSHSAASTYTRKLLFVMVPLVLGAALTGQRMQEKPHAYVPPNGFVPDAATAVKIAEAVLTPVYGADQIRSEMPLAARLEKGVWTVEGKGPSTPGAHGGVAIVELSKKDATVLRMSHGK